MKWADLFQFMLERDPGFAQSIVGISRAEVEKCQDQLGITFPDAYVEFLLAMGSSSGRYHPLGANMDATFRSALRQIPAEQYDIQRYFLIGREFDLGQVPGMDIYLQLSTSDGNDAELLEAENGVWAPDDEMRFTLLEYLSINAWRTFEAYRRKHNRVFMILPDLDAACSNCLEPAVEELKKLGLSIALPPLARALCLQSKDMGALVEVCERPNYIQVVLARDNELQLEHDIEVLLDAIPDTLTNEALPSIRVR